VTDHSICRDGSFWHADVQMRADAPAERNPAFQPSVKGHSAFMATKRSLKDPTRLRECSWQQITTAMRRNSRLDWLTESLRLKYGL